MCMCCAMFQIVCNEQSWAGSCGWLFHRAILLFGQIRRLSVSRKGASGQGGRPRACFCPWLGVRGQFRRFCGETSGKCQTSVLMGQVGWASSELSSFAMSRPVCQMVCTCHQHLPGQRWLSHAAKCGRHLPLLAVRLWRLAVWST